MKKSCPPSTAVKQAVLAFLALGLAGLSSWVASDYDEVEAFQGEARSEMVHTFFFLENKTETAVKIRVLVDETELFIRELSAPEVAPFDEEPQVLPPLPPYPTLELKIPLKLDAREMEIQELLHLGTLARLATFEIEGFGEKQGGFRITLRPDGILLNQDYLPIR